MKILGSLVLAAWILASPSLAQEAISYQKCSVQGDRNMSMPDQFETRSSPEVGWNVSAGVDGGVESVAGVGCFVPSPGKGRDLGDTGESSLGRRGENRDEYTGSESDCPVVELILEKESSLCNDPEHVPSGFESTSPGTLAGTSGAAER